MKFKYIHKYQGGGQAKQIDASFGLPEVNIYPQNEFGDIARSQGINRARNWKKVKEGTTKGINDFYNDPRTQMVMAGLPLPSMLDAAGDAIKVVGPVIGKYLKNKTFIKNSDYLSEKMGYVKINHPEHIQKNIPKIYAFENIESKTPTNIKEAIQISLKGSRSAKDFVNSDAVKNSAKRNAEIYNRINKTNIPSSDYTSKASLSSKFVDNFDDYVNTNSPTGNTSTIGGLYDEASNQLVFNKNSITEPVAFHENLHALGYGNKPYNQMKNKYIFDNEKTKKLSEQAKDYYIKGEEPAVHYATLGNKWGVSPGDSYPGRKIVENMILDKGLSGSTVYTKLNTNRDYRRFWDAISGKYFSITPIPFIGAQVKTKDKK